ncbi:aminopeptidase [Haloplasma contractile]|uniref:Leucyl aminopeptidase protein n=1 Tax=Haloplasma contractile SSD-17B TaxID=1033810 RepID=U2FJL3_9MOLU|nr:aminopeptidase [Haloplasma contractile]ERJ13005.1 leucyl aminopeptidase protein [Haloplasma contractile SSD-17B]
MRDPRIKKIAKNLLEYSNNVKKGQHVLIQGHVASKPLLKELVKQTHELGAHPHLELRDDELTRELTLETKEDRLDRIVSWKLNQLRDIDAVISVFAGDNDYELSDVSSDIKMMSAKMMQPVSDEVVGNKQWVLLNYPTASMAQKAKMSTEQFEDFVFDISSVDYAKMASAMQVLKKRMEQTNKVHIKGNGTDLTFSIKGIPAIPCAGECNIPDGEVFTAPVKDSVNGTIQYNAPSPFRGTVFNNVKLTFENGKIIEATADNDIDQLNEIFDTDEGARYVGEFAIGLNPLIKDPMGDILFDEKIDGSFHFTPGKCYEGEADNGNISSIHWDLVCIQRPEYGGGEIYFDDILIRKDGRFVIEELECLNPEHLV